MRCFFKMDVPSIAIFKCRRVDLRFRLDIHPSSTGSGEDGDNLTAEDEAGGRFVANLGSGSLGNEWKYGS